MEVKCVTYRSSFNNNLKKSKGEGTIKDIMQDVF